MLPAGRAAAVVLLGLLPALAHAGDAEVDGLIEQARRDKAALRYQEGLAVLDRALRLGRSTPTELVAIHRLAGELAAGIDDATTATAHFRRLLAIAPDSALPEGTSPKVTGPFAIAAADIRERGPLRVGFRPSWDRAPRLVVTIDNDPAGQAVGARASVRTPDGRRIEVHEPLVAARAALALPAGRLALVAAVIDEHGNALVQHGSPDAPITVAPPPGRARPPLYARWWPWAGASLLFAGSATWAGVIARGAQADLDAIDAGTLQTTWEDTQAIERRGRRAALLANVGFGAAGATAALAVFLYVRERRSGGDASMAIGAGDGALTMTLSGRF